MNEYHKIQSVFFRDPATKHKTFLMGQWSMPEFAYLANNQWAFTEKVDGTNIRVMWDGNAVTFGGKTDNAQIPAQLVTRLQERFLPQVERFTEKFGEQGNVCFYGEGYGAKIQNGGLYRPDQDFVLFDVKIGNWWLYREDVEKLAEGFGLDIVPIIGYGTLHQAIEQVRRGFNSQWGSFAAEGIVARPCTELRARNGERVITKIKHKDF